MIYSCQSWTISKEMTKIQEATEMWFLRILFRILWTAKITKHEVLQIPGLKRELLTGIMKRQLGFLGHILRRDGLQRACLLRIIAGKTKAHLHGWNLRRSR